MTKNIKIAQKYLHSRPIQNNVAYALVGEDLISATLGDYCFANVRRAPLTFKATSYEVAKLELVDGVRVAPHGLLLKETRDHMVLRLKADNTDRFHIPTNTDELSLFWTVVEKFLKCFEDALIPASMDERIENGLVIDLSKITPRGLGVLLVGYRNLYEKSRWYTIHKLLGKGVPFEKAFHLAQFFKATENVKQDHYTRAEDSHTILEYWCSGTTDAIIIQTVKDNFLLNREYLFDGVSFQKSDVVAWSNRVDWSCRYNQIAREHWEDRVGRIYEEDVPYNIKESLGETVSFGGGWDTIKVHTDQHIDDYLEKNKEFLK